MTDVDIDISVIYKGDSEYDVVDPQDIDNPTVSANDNIMECINYCADRGFNMQLSESREQCVGEFVIELDTKTYYNPYVIHLLYVKMFINDLNSAMYRSLTCYNPRTGEFYSGAGSKIFMCRRDAMVGYPYIEQEIRPGCTVDRLDDIGLPVEDQDQLDLYKEGLVKIGAV